MTPDEAINAIWASLSLMGLIYLIFWRTRGLAVDWFRDEMFKLRDEFFDMAASGHIDFNHPAYGALRIMMNGFIRYCHKLSLLNVILLPSSLERKQSDVGLFDRNWKNAIKDVDSRTLQGLEETRKRIQSLVITYIIISSPFIAILLFFFLLLGFAATAIGEFIYGELMKFAVEIRKSGRFRDYLRYIDDAAYATGDI